LGVNHLASPYNWGAQKKSTIPTTVKAGRKKDTTTGSAYNPGYTARELNFSLIILYSDDDLRTVLNEEINDLQSASRYSNVCIRECDSKYFWTNGNINLRQLVTDDVVEQWCHDHLDMDRTCFSFRRLRIVPHKPTSKSPTLPLIAVQNPAWSPSSSRGLRDKWIGYPRGVFSDNLTFEECWTRCRLDDEP